MFSLIIGLYESFKWSLVFLGSVIFRKYKLFLGSEFLVYLKKKEQYMVEIVLLMFLRNVL